MNALPSRLMIALYYDQFGDELQVGEMPEPVPAANGVATYGTERGFLDGSSLEFDMGDGFREDGTLWIEKQFAVSDSMPTKVTTSFYLFNEFQSEFNTFHAKSVIGVDNPDEQIDFTTIGETDSAQGWVPFKDEQIIGPAADPVWVALGIRVAWETPRTYWIDRVTVTTRAVPEPTGACLLLAGPCGLTILCR